MNAMTPAFSLRSSLDLKISSYQRAIISIPSRRGEEKDLLTPNPAASDGKFTTQEHLALLIENHQLSPDVPLLVFGLRNTLVNYRCIAQVQGLCHAIAPEDPKCSQRPYYGLVLDSYSRIALATRSWKPDEVIPQSDTFISGVPASWEGMTGTALFNTMLIEAADHSHLFRIPRGNHPQATEASRALWQQMHEIFKQNLHATAEEAIARMSAAVQDGAPLSIEDSYLHQVIGCNAAGEIYCCVHHDSIMAIGERLARMGFSRSVCLENSGSVQPSFFPKGAQGPEIVLLRAANFRPKGRALLVIELEDATFQTLEN